MSEEIPETNYHEDTRRFRAALSHTASATGFTERLIEKDYYCSVLLRDFAVLFRQGLVFKGGTCLSKVHIDFFRLSEDLDFGVSINADASRAQRRAAAEPIKKHLPGIANRIQIFTETVTLTGHNNNTQYNAEISYRSAITGELEPIKIEVSLREETILPAGLHLAKTILIDPYTMAPAVGNFPVNALSLNEAYAEKSRAALTRREPAIRDFFDIDAAIQKGLINFISQDFLDLVIKKLATTSDPVDISKPRIVALRRQIETQLKPVLRTVDYNRFAIDPVIAILETLARDCRAV